MSDEPSSIAKHLQSNLSRRHFVQGLAATAGFAASVGISPAFAASTRNKDPMASHQPQVLTDARLQLTIGGSQVNFTGRTRPAVTVNNRFPAPILRWREGDNITIQVHNALPDAMTSLHWHGLQLPSNMDGVPGMSFNGIAPGESYLYHFPLIQSGTYWYHSHSLFQEHIGLFGAIIIDPIEPPPYNYDREHVILLSDWTDINPVSLYRRMKKMASHDNYYRRTVVDFFRDARRDGLSPTIADRSMWGKMRMTPTDISDINAHTYTYLINGTTATSNWTGLFKPGEKVLLRFINGSGMTYFDVRIPGLKMTVVAADGQYIHPVSVDEFRIAVAETFDVIVEPSGQDAYTIFAQDSGRTGYTRATLATHNGLEAPIPPLDPRPLLTMADMGHDMDMSGGGHDHNHMDHHMAAMQQHPASETNNPLIDMQAMTPTPRLDDPGIGLRNNGRDVLRYSQLHSLFPDPDGRDPGRTLEIHLTGHMEKFSWSFDGIPFASSEPLKLKYGERLRITLVNDTMMSHPIHLHGMWSDLENEKGEFQVRKHTVEMPPGTRRSYRVRADYLGRWAYHCHLLYHMELGMMREVRVEE